MTKTQEKQAEAAASTDTFALIYPGMIVPDPDNVRDELTGIDDLAASIFQLGLQQPLRVRQTVLHGEQYGLAEGCQVFMVIAGHRRLAAIKSLMEQELWNGDVPCMIAPDTISSDDVTAAMLVENLQRADLNPVEEANAFERLTKEFRYKRAELAAKIGRSESYVADRLALLKLPESIRESVSAGHYPMSHALLLKGVPAGVVETLTKGGRRVVTDVSEINRAVKSHEYDTLKAALLAAAAKSGIEMHEGQRYEFRNNSDEIAVFASLDDAKLLAKYDGAPKGARLVVDDSPYMHRFAVELRKPLTAKQIEARQAKYQAELNEEEQARKAEQAARYEAERAGWSPAYQAWVDECDRLRAEHVAETEAYEQALINAHVQWAATVDTKKVARWAMTEVIANADWGQLRKLLDALGVDHANQSEKSVLAAWIGDDAKRMVQACALVLTIDSWNGDPNELATDDLNKFLTRADITEPADLVLPVEPPKTEDTADDPIHDVA